MSSKKIKNNDYTTKEYKNFIKIKSTIKEKKVSKKKISIKINSNFEDKKEFNVPKIKNKQIININYYDKNILLTRVRNKFLAFSEKCPHLGVSLKNGFILDNQIKCPAHGVEFNLKNGFSGCKLKLRTYEVKILKNNSKLVIF
tara:strand:+ start:25 stop:453 length:429 start_codon:yes stop_codon:yes gene_type:complete